MDREKIDSIIKELRERQNNYRTVLNKETDKTQGDGGPGSGNWGHEGRPGEIGGSAKGGGLHNRITKKSGGYSSFTKVRKASAEPHKLTKNELRYCPNGTMIVGAKIQAKKVDDHHFVNMATGELLTNTQVSKWKGEHALAIPRSASPNYNRLKVKTADNVNSAIGNVKAFAEERKDHAFGVTRKTRRDADKLYREVTGKVWRELDEETKDALHGYTSYSATTNRPLRDGKDALAGVPKALRESIKNNINNMTKAISKCLMPRDAYLSRGTSMNSLSRMFGFSQEEYKKNPEGALRAIVGRLGTDEGFLSCGATSETGFTYEPVQLHIYCPKGTMGMYMEPFSQFGKGDKQKWDGTSQQKKLSKELEVLLQRGTTLRATKAEAKDGTIHIYCDVIAQGWDDM